MKKTFCFFIMFLISIFVNLSCIGMENINSDFICDHYLNCSDKSYTMTHYANGQQTFKDIVCSQCAKEHLIKKLKKWMNLDRAPFYYCGLLRPTQGVKIKYCKPTADVIGYYHVTPSIGTHIPNSTVREEVCPEGNEKYLAKYCFIDLENDRSAENNEAKINICKNPSCVRYNDMISIIKGKIKANNINYASGTNYVEVKECENKGHVELDCSIKIN